jgi:rhomboid protease GluP
MSDLFWDSQSKQGEQDAPAVPLRPQHRLQPASPIGARILLACNLLVFVAMVVYGMVAYGDLDGSTNSEVLMTFGMKVNFLVAQGEIWRLFTAMFLHIGVLHLLSNLYALYSLGPLVEGYFGHRRFLIIYLLGGLFGSVASYAFSDASSAGASGAIFALIGALTLYFFYYRDYFGARGQQMMQNMLMVIIVNLIFGLSVPFIDNWGHIGGLVGGVLLAFGIMPRYRPPDPMRLGAQALEELPRHLREFLWVAGAIALLWFSIQVIN